MTRRAFMAAAVPPVLLADSTTTVNPTRAHEELVAGNVRFVSGHTKHPHSSRKWASKHSSAQHPHAVVLCCSDSRVVPEILFDVGLGDLFTIRVAGNSVNEDELASIEYAVQHLGVGLCVVMGHSNCGAVRAVIERETMPLEIQHLVAGIREAHELALKLPQIDRDIVAATVRQNVHLGVGRLRRQAPLLRQRVDSGHLRVEGAIYDLATGRVDWLSVES